MVRSALFILLVSAGVACAQVGDTVHSHRVKGITDYGTYFGFDRHDHHNVILKVRALGYTMVPADSELPCFVVNHSKENLRLKYEIWQYDDNGDTKRWYRLLNAESEKGDLSWEWAERERKDPALLARHHKALTDALELSTGSAQ